MIEEAITRAEAFSVMYTPFATRIKPENIEKVKEVFMRTHPTYVDCIYTGEFTFFTQATGVLVPMATKAGGFMVCWLFVLTGVSFNLKSSNVNLFLRL
jgi:hypothetical protein